LLKICILEVQAGQEKCTAPHLGSELDRLQGFNFMSKQNVLVTYTAPHSFQLSDSWKQVQSALRSQLPLRNIHWKSASRPSIRTIQELDIDLVPLDTTRGENTSQIPVTLLEKPLLNIYIVTCEVCVVPSVIADRVTEHCVKRTLKRTGAPSRSRSRTGTPQSLSGRTKNGLFCRSCDLTPE